jgi:hypothetical protein
VARLRQQAERDLSTGAFDGAREALTQAIAVDRTSGEQIEARLKARNLSEAESLATRAGLARTRGDYRGAALEGRTRERAPLDWAQTQAERGARNRDPLAWASMRKQSRERAQRARHQGKQDAPSTPSWRSTDTQAPRMRLSSTARDCPVLVSLGTMPR